MTAAPAWAPFAARANGRCPVKGCRARASTAVLGERCSMPAGRDRFGNDRHREEVRYSIDSPARRLSPQGGYQLLPGSEPLPLVTWQIYIGPWCVEHRRPLRFKVVAGVQADEVRCDSRCEAASGFDCECSCGGANHGIAHGA